MITRNDFKKDNGISDVEEMIDYARTEHFKFK